MNVEGDRKLTKDDDDDGSGDDDDKISSNDEGTIDDNAWGCW